jgi:hypothetical protein
MNFEKNIKKMVQEIDLYQQKKTSLRSMHENLWAIFETVEDVSKDFNDTFHNYWDQIEEIVASEEIDNYFKKINQEIIPEFRAEILASSCLKIEFGENFPAELIERGFLLDESGINRFAWKYEDVLRVIEYCLQNKIAILSGEVYFKDDFGVETIYDGWVFDRGEKSWNEYVKLSCCKAFDYIKNYYSKSEAKKENVLYSVQNVLKTS